MSTYDTYKYNGLRKLFTGENNYEKFLSSPKGILKGIESLKIVYDDAPMLMIYHEDCSSFNRTIRFPSAYKDCIFVAGKINILSDSKISFGKTFNQYSLDKILDIIPIEQISNIKNNNSDLKLYRFTTDASEDQSRNSVSISLYDIIHSDPASAFLSAKNNYNSDFSIRMPLRLSSISSLSPGMQFNKGRGEDKLDDIY